MYTIILFAILGLASGIKRASSSDEKGTSKYITGSCVGTAAGGVIGLVLALMVVGSAVPMKDVVYGPAKLAAMRSQNGISGSFIFGSGSINSDNTYNFLQHMKDGSMVPGSVPANGLVHLIEDPELKNTGSWSITISEPDKSSPLYPWSIGAELRSKAVRQEFRVPVGTVVQQFNIK
jgi:hypothetical protein